MGMRKGWLRFATVVLTSTLGAAQQKPAAVVTVIRAAVLIDGAANQPKRDQVIVIRGNTIEAVGDAATVKAPADAKVITFGPETTVLPGLIDCHTHIFLQGEDPKE